MVDHHMILLLTDKSFAVFRNDDTKSKMFVVDVPSDLECNNIRKAIISQNNVWILDDDGKLIQGRFSYGINNHFKIFDTKNIDEPILDIVGNDKHLFLHKIKGLWIRCLGHTDSDDNTCHPITFFNRINLNSKYKDTVVKIACGDAFTLFLTNTNKVYSCGSIESVYCLDSQIVLTTKFMNRIDAIVKELKFSSLVGYNEGTFTLVPSIIRNEVILNYAEPHNHKFVHTLKNGVHIVYVYLNQTLFRTITINHASDSSNLRSCFSSKEDSLFYLSKTTTQGQKTVHQLILEKSKEFKLASDTINIGDSSVYAFIPFIQVRTPQFYDLLRKADLFNSEKSQTIIQDLIDYCFSQNCAFLKNYSSQMIAELLYLLEKMGMIYNEFTAPLIFQSRVHIKLSKDFNPNADAYVLKLKQEGITPKLLGTNYDEYVAQESMDLVPIGSVLGKLFNSDQSPDTSIIIDQFGLEKVKCHRSVLIAQSAFFEAFYTGHFASNEINLFPDEDTQMDIKFEEMSEEERQMLVDPESEIKTRTLRNILMMFYEIEPVVEKDLVIPMLDMAHKLDSEILVMKCLNMFENNLDEESYQVVNQWLGGLEQKTDIQNMILKTADSWLAKKNQRGILFENYELQEEFCKDIQSLTHFQIHQEFIPNETTHFVAKNLDRKDYNFLCAVAGNCILNT